MTTKYIEIDRAIETALLLLEEGEDEQTLAYNAALVAFIKNMENVPAADVAPRWIPVTERLPEEDKEVLISYRYKEGEGNTSHSKIDITSYGQMSFGGNKVGRVKHWRAPFEYFESNYEVIAWMPLPTPYKGGEEE